MDHPNAVAARILVVDDDLANRTLITKALKRKGFVCSSAAGAVEARGLLDSRRYALVITDMRMWGEEGLDLIRYVTEEYPETAAMMVSGQNDRELEQKALRAGASSFIRKPVDVEDLLEKVESALERREAAIKLRKHQEW